jgi:rubredoxin
MRRDMVWVQSDRFMGWACSKCAWIFNPSGAPTGKSLEEIKRQFDLQRDKAFAAHVCNIQKQPAEQLRAQHQRASWSLVATVSVCYGVSDKIITGPIFVERR